MKKNKYAALAALALAAATSLAAVASAHADTFSVTADRSQHLTVVGDKVTVTLAGIPAGQGVYVRLCKGAMADVMKGRPTLCFGQGAWVSTDAAQLAFGAGDATKPVVLAVQSAFTSNGTAVDCQVDACGIHIRRDHMGGSTDFALDRFIPVTFGTAPAPAAVASVKAGKVQITVANAKGNQATFVVGGKKYVRNVTNDSFVFSVAAPKGKFVASASVLRKQLVRSSLTN
ncbi:MAG: hypothetical protein RL605_790 [Actinomycetota bacterium]|jgi:hypothetical protein